MYRRVEERGIVNITKKMIEAGAKALFAAIMESEVEPFSYDAATKRLYESWAKACLNAAGRVR